MPDQYYIQYSATNRAGCSAKKSCKFGENSKIDKGALRIGVDVDIRGHTSIKWRHAECATAKVLSNITSRGSGARGMLGFDTLTADDQKKITDAVATCTPVALPGAAAAVANETKADNERTPKKKVAPKKKPATKKKPAAKKKAAAKKKPAAKKAAKKAKKPAAKKAKKPVAKSAKKAKKAAPKKAAAGKKKTAKK